MSRYDIFRAFYDYLKPLFYAARERTAALRSASTSQVKTHDKMLRQALGQTFRPSSVFSHRQFPLAIRGRGFPTQPVTVVPLSTTLSLCKSSLTTPSKACFFFFFSLLFIGSIYTTFLESWLSSLRVIRPFLILELRLSCLLLYV